MTLKLPSQSPGGPEMELATPTRVVIIGANGSGKTRLGIWIEGNNHATVPVHRISAQKALSLPDFAQMKSLEQAEKELYFGRADQHASAGRKFQDRWGGSPATHLLFDFEKVLALLFAQEAERDRRHTEQTKLAKSYVAVPDSAIDSIVRLWEYLMPHRTISFRDGTVVVGRGTPTEYHAKEMSDGERVTLYLIGQCLTAPTGTILVIDEPEMHLHRSLVDKLWNKIEELCPDKSFVYITHDLDFAVTRTGARKIWVSSYEGGSWTWAYLPSDDVLPERLVLELMGNRKPVLFCEGERGGLDHVLYQLCYPRHHVVPRGSADQVVESVKALQANKALHSLSAFGIIDRDVRTDDELVAHLEWGVHALPFAEVENLLCVESLVRAVAEKLALTPSDTVACVTNFVSTALRDEFDAQVVMRAARRIRYHLACYRPTANDRTGLHAGVSQLVASLNLGATIAESESVLQAAVKSGKLDEMLMVYNRKSLADRISSCFGLKQEEYPALLFRMMKGPEGAKYLDLVRAYLPQK